MSSTLGESSTTDEFDVEDSTYDRYSVNPSYQRGKDGEESMSLRHSVASGSSFDSGTYGTGTYVSEGSTTLQRNEFFDEELSLESHHMVMDQWVDSTCTCLDYPAMVYQRICMQTETSLLRESNGIPRSPIYNNNANAPTNLGIAAAKRRNVRVEGKATTKDGQTNDVDSSMGGESRRMQIQRKRDIEYDGIEDSEGKRSDNQASPKKEPEEAIASDTPDRDNTSQLETTSMNESFSEKFEEKERMTENKKINEEAQSISNESTKSMLERAIQKVAKEDEERDINIRLSETFKETGTKLDPPTDVDIEATREGQAVDKYAANLQDRDKYAANLRDTDKYASNLQDTELFTSDGPIESSPKEEEDVVDVPEVPSYGGERDPSPPVINQMISEATSQKSDSAQRTQASDDEKSTTSSMEIIDVISIDDQDSWTPGSRNEVDHSTTKIEDSKHQQAQNSSRSNDPSISSIHVSSAPANDQHDDRRITTDSSTVDELWIEEEAKLNTRASSNRASSTALKDLAAAKSAEALWNEERMKLQTISDVVVRSQSRRQLIQKVLEGTGRQDLYKSSKANFRSLSAGRSRPSPDGFSVIEPSRSLASKPSGDSLNVVPLISRSRDLVAVRSIEEAQRIRSSKRDTTKYTIDPHQKADKHSYAKQSSSKPLYGEHSRADLHQPDLDRLMRSLSLQRSRSRDPTGRRGQSSVEAQAKKYLQSEERDDQESLPSSPAAGNTPVGRNWSDYDTAVSATKELRKLEKKIEKQVRRADDSQIDQSKEKRKMERKLSKKLRSIIKSDDINTQKMSSKEIRKLEKHLAQTLNSENENRSSKLKRIKHKERQRFTQPVPNELQQSNGYATTHSRHDNQYLQESREKRPERSRYEDLKGLRSRYVRRGIGRRSYSRIPDSD